MKNSAYLCHRLYLIAVCSARGGRTLNLAAKSYSQRWRVDDR